MWKIPHQRGSSHRRLAGLAVTVGMIGTLAGAVHSSATGSGSASAPVSDLRRVDSSYLCGIEGCNHNQVLV
jgi:hypothetical protein